MVHNPNDNKLSQLLPFHFDLYMSCTKFGKMVFLVLAIQYNVFECGGIAIVVCVSHKVADGASTVNFVNA